MILPEYDVVINGAGPAGSTLALLLAAKTSRRNRIALIARQFASSAQSSGISNADPRTLALNHGSRALLEQLGAWPAKSAAIRTVHVSQRGKLGRTLIECPELGVERLGSVVSYADLLSTLHGALAHSGIDLIESASTNFALADHVEFKTPGRRLTATLAVQSDGGRHGGLHREYAQHAVVTVVEAEQPRPDQAFERFTAQGPLAMLPHPDGAGTYGVVWCCRPDRAEHLASLDCAAFSTELQHVFGTRMGHLKCVGERHVFPLALHAGPSLLNRRTIAIGNAAQTMHPVAGQGLNLGLRDAAQLSQALGPWLLRSQSDPDAALAGFVRKRRPDRWLTVGLTDFLPRIFATRNPLVQHACGLSLLALDLLPPLRIPIARHLLQGLRT